MRILKMQKSFIKKFQQEVGVMAKMLEILVNRKDNKHSLCYIYFLDCASIENSNLRQFNFTMNRYMPVEGGGGKWHVLFRLQISKNDVLIAADEVFFPQRHSVM